MHDKSVSSVAYPVCSVTSPSRTQIFPIKDYDLAATLTSGQAFRWRFEEQSWIGVIGQYWVRLRLDPFSLTAETSKPVRDWSWLIHYLQLDFDFTQMLLTLPDDEPIRAATNACRGLRLLRQDPWECLASFILSSTKQIVQIQQIVELLCQRFGQPLATPAAFSPAYTFPTAARIARATETELRACKMGFRARYLLEVARLTATGQFDPIRLQQLPVDLARHELMRLPGVGPKIADCVLLFAYGFLSAFPVDVWVAKALRQLYFPRRRVNSQRIQRFVATHFGPNAGYAQQYLFHYMRVKRKLIDPRE